MRPRLDVLLGLAVAAVAVLAALDAFRSEPRAEAPKADEAEAAVAALESIGASGRLIAADEACRRIHVRLPSLLWRENPRVKGCRVFGPRGSIGIRDGNVGWYAFPGAVTLMLTRAQLAEELGGEGGEAEFFVTRAAWLRSTRFAALVSADGLDGTLLAIFERARLVGEPVLLDPDFRELRASRSFGYVAAVSSRGEVALFDREGIAVDLPTALREPRAIAWSPDERLTAVATDEGIAVFPSGSEEEPSTVIPVQAEDLDWLP